MPARLHWTNSEGNQLSIDIENRIFIGRTCSGTPSEKRIIIDTPEVSRDHAMITFSGGRLSIRDTSRNGTRLNCNRLSPGAEHPLSNADTLDIGAHLFQVEIYDEASWNAEPADLSETLTLSREENITHLVADVRGFSTFSQNSPSSTVFFVMNEIYNVMSKIVHSHHGTIKDYAGDCIFAYWEHDQGHNNDKAVMACEAAQEQLTALNQTLSIMAVNTENTGNLNLGWGIATGSVILSHYGQRNENVAVVGDATNLAFRLSAMANKSIDSPIVMCETTASLVKDELPISPLGEVETKGRAGKEIIYGLSRCIDT